MGGIIVTERGVETDWVELLQEQDVIGVCSVVGEDARKVLAMAPQDLLEARAEADRVFGGVTPVQAEVMRRRGVIADWRVTSVGIPEIILHRPSNAKVVTVTRVD